MDFKYSPIKKFIPPKDLTNSSHTPNKTNSILSPKNQFKKVLISPSKFINTGSSNEIGKHMAQSAKYNSQHKNIQQIKNATNFNTGQKQAYMASMMKTGNTIKSIQAHKNLTSAISSPRIVSNTLQNINIANPQRLLRNQQNFNSQANLNQFFTIKQKAKNRQRKYSVNDLTASSHAKFSSNNLCENQCQNQKNTVQYYGNPGTRRNTVNYETIKKQNIEFVHLNEPREQRLSDLNHDSQNFQFIRDRKLSYQPNIAEVNMLKKQKSSGQLWLIPQNMASSRRKSDLFPFQKKQQKFSTTPMYSPKDIHSIKRDFEKKPFQKDKKLRKFSDNNQVSKFCVPSFLAKKPKRQNQQENLSYKQFQSNKEVLNLNRAYTVQTVQQMAQKKLSLKNFRVIRQLGEGKFGKVLLVQEINCKFICAMKVFKKAQITNDKFIDQFIREMKIQSYLNHPNVIRLYGYFDDAANIYVLIELACDGTLFKFLEDRQNQEPQSQITSSFSTIQSNIKIPQNNSLTQKQVSIVMYQLCGAMSYLHSQNIIHRDLKPQNIVIHQKIIKLCDFGWSVFKGSTMRSTFCGTPLYLCPELIVGQEYDEKVDIWAIGIMFYEFLIGTNPFKIHVEQDLANIVYQSVNLNSSVDPLVKNVISGCLDKNPKNRFNIKQILNHDFFKQNCPQIMNKLSKSSGNKLSELMI